ncbi:hypothetical protein [Paraburkholderia sp. UCT2]|uniref:hypothetical protein n=1 Tax=Paraburkholderia sp. UCT2 TaxID=2615208 RepID=UPI0016564121|nr:hypothetical protein [Paraburkholderia sp. UCT2]MBC8730010.1 hypothetical protein [Paraburkholderia sp. UCT2]
MRDATIASEWVDPDDAPEITDEWIEQADQYQGNTLVRRGRGRPTGCQKPATTVRFEGGA